MDSILQSLPDQIVLLDQTATIIDTNRSWQKKHPDCNGLNFLQVYEDMVTRPTTKDIRRAIQKMICGEQHDFSCGLTIESTPFSMQITSIMLNNVMTIMVSLRDLTSCTEHDNKTELHQQLLQLSETNIALNALLKNREQDRLILENGIASNVQHLIMPYIERLAQGPLAPQEQTLVTIIKKYLDTIMSPFLHRITTLNQQLTPQEIKVASLIRQGQSSKQIGEALQLTVNGVGFHRKSIRTKLGLTGSGKNLRSQLMALR